MKEEEKRMCPKCGKPLGYGWFHSAREYRYFCCHCDFVEVDV